MKLLSLVVNTDRAGLTGPDAGFRPVLLAGANEPL